MKKPLDSYTSITPYIPPHAHIRSLAPIRAPHLHLTPLAAHLPPLPPHPSALAPTSLPTALQQPTAPTFPSHPSTNSNFQHSFPICTGQGVPGEIDAIIRIMDYVYLFEEGGGPRHAKYHKSTDITTYVRIYWTTMRIAVRNQTHHLPQETSILSLRT